MKINTTKNIEKSAIKMLVYGFSGVGKTTLAKTINEKTLIISSESGLLSLKKTDIDYIDISTDDKGEMLPKEKRFSRLADIYRFLNAKEAREKYKTIFVDSLSEISQNLIEQLQMEYPDRKDSLVLYGESAKRMRAFIKAYRDLPYYNVIFTALAEQDQDENKRRIYAIQMVGKISQQLPAFFDEVFFMSTTQKDDQGNFKRILHTQSSDNFVAKDRSGNLNQVEPADLNQIMEKIKC